jgi:polyisoprenoid-binding protein YceI
MACPWGVACSPDELASLFYCLFTVRKFVSMFNSQIRSLSRSVLLPVAFGVSALVSGGASANGHSAPLQINSAASSLSFNTTKSGAVGVGGITETMQFTRYEGGLDAQGRIALKIDLSSIDSGIGLRNERMQSLLWNVGQYPSVTFTAQLSPETVQKLHQTPMLVDVEGQLTMAGQSKPVKTQLQVTPVAGKVLVSTRRPILVNAADYGLTAGVEALREVMGLSYMSTTVPVTLNLELSKKPS